MKTEYLSELLFQHDCVIVTDLGGFLKSNVPARIDKDTHRFFPPGCRIAFNASLSANDGLLANHIAKTAGISFREATADIRRWVEHLYHQLHSGEKLHLKDIGILFLDAEGNIQFEPEDTINFLGDSFGLPSFTAQAIAQKQTAKEAKSTPEQNPLPSKLRHLIPETLKWAAVLTPFIAFTIWGIVHTNKIGSYFHNYSGFYSWVISTPGKSGTIKPDASTSAPVVRPANPATILASHNIDLSPAVISYESLRSSIGRPDAETSFDKASLGDSEYFVIGGAFKEHNNALKLISVLKLKGYPARIVDTTSKGMYIVSIKGFSSRKEAFGELPTIKTSGFEGAWVMHKH